MTKKHTFHIPVMGIGFTIDTPLKVAHLGIDSVISIVDDMLLEKLRKKYSENWGIPYKEISTKIDDFRAKRITSYLNLINDQARKKFNEFKNLSADKINEVKDYFHMLPDTSVLKQEFHDITSEYFDLDKVRTWINENLTMGSIDVNIMTKLDKANYLKGQKLDTEFNDAHAALRGFAQSDLESSVILSAGMNPRLYGYIENFDDFYPNADGYIKKRIVLKVSDYRSALIQGKFLAKKGLWVSEYRVESGLNCGGHAFATDGFLMGPILEEFRDQRSALVESVFEILVRALEEKGRTVPEEFLELRITAQGGVGTAEEHQFLMEHYGIDSVGWGTPFLLVPEATNVDEETRQKLMGAKEKDLYLSNISPLGVPFNSLRGNSKDIEKMALVEAGRPGSSCPKQYLVNNTEYTDKAICTASSRYQKKKIAELNAAPVSDQEYEEQFSKIVDKSCICVGLGTSVLQNNNIERRIEGDAVSICPGPNMAYFSKLMSMKDITGHIYGRLNMLTRSDRPNMFIKELHLYLDYLSNKVDEAKQDMSDKQDKYLTAFSKNLESGINYYNDLFDEAADRFNTTREHLQEELEASSEKFYALVEQIQNMKLQPVTA
jgi:hypothetical protein